MHVTLTVTFTPTNLEDITHALMLETGQGALEVPLLTRRDPPRLTLPQQISVGPTIVGNKQVNFAFDMVRRKLLAALFVATDV